MRAIFFIGLLFLYSCTNSKTEISHERRNDTSIVIHSLLDKYLGNWERNKSDSHLLKDKPFGDSIVFISNEKFNSFFSDYDKAKIKVLDSNEVCDYAVNYFRPNPPYLFFPNVLLLTNFRETDSSFYASIQAECVLPNFDKEGHRLETTDGSYAGNDKCSFSRMCGPGYEIEMLKRADSLVFIRGGRWSD